MDSEPARKWLDRQLAKTGAYRLQGSERCPHCDFAGSPGEVDEHRATGVHNDEEQKGGNKR